MGEGGPENAARRGKGGKEQGSSGVKGYIILYNAAAFAAWLWVAFVLLATFAEKLRGRTGSSSLWSRVAIPLKLAQTLAVLEVVHAGCGLVRSPIFTAAIQVLSRLHVVWVVWHFVGLTEVSGPIWAAVGAWTAVELIRYPFYLVQLAMPDKMPHALRWLRYSVFGVLYPIGILGEVSAIVFSLGEMRRNRAVEYFPARMPNSLNFELRLFPTYCAVLAGYLPGAFIMYSHMLRQRRKVLGTDSGSEKKDV